MKEQNIKKVIELQGRIAKLHKRIMDDVEKHNKLVLDELRPLTEDILHNTIYQVGDMTYKRGRVFCQLECSEYGLGPKAEGLATLRKIVVGDMNAHTDDTESGSSAPLSK